MRLEGLYAVCIVLVWMLREKIYLFVDFNRCNDILIIIFLEVKDTANDICLLNTVLINLNGLMVVQTI